MNVTSQQIRVLLVDDHTVVRQGLCRLLEDQPGIEVIHQAASDGMLGLEVTRATRPDVVILDVQMRGMGGVEAAGLIKSEFPNVRVIGLSMFADEVTSAAMLSAGADAFLSKDCSFPDLVAAIRGHRAAR